MGNSGVKKIDANNQKGNVPMGHNQQQSQQQNQREVEQMMQLIKEAFRNCASNGWLTKDKFNQALAILEALGFKRLRDTPLADRLFSIFDVNHTGQIDEALFSKGIGQIIGDKENAINYTFRAYDRDHDKMISKKQFMQFIEESWRAAFRLLSEELDHNSGISMQDIQNWSSSKISILNENSAQIFNKLSNGSEKIDYMAFKNYVINGGINDISAQLANKTTLVPLNLLHLH